MLNIRRSNERGRADFGWLRSAHSFSFGQYYDPNHMGVSVLRVINDDTVAPSRGFDTHGHKDMEIISYVTEGALKHKDSTGNDYVIPAGDIQRMSAGTGIYHSEFNASDTDDAKFLQIWILPAEKGIKPSYEQKTIVDNGVITPLVTPDGSDGSVSVNQNMTLSRVKLSDNESTELSLGDNIGYLHVIKGSIELNDSTENATISEGDAVTVAGEKRLSVNSLAETEALWFELPQ